MTGDPGCPPLDPPYEPPIPRDPDCNVCAPHPRHLFEACDRPECPCLHSDEVGIYPQLEE